MMDDTERCSLCGAVIEGKALSVAGMPVCEKHRDEAEKRIWSAVGYYRRDALAEQRKKELELNGIGSLIARSSEPPGFRLLIEEHDRSLAQEVLSALGERIAFCTECRSEFDEGELFCPSCGAKVPERDR